MFKWILNKLRKPQVVARKKEHKHEWLPRLDHRTEEEYYVCADWDCTAKRRG